MARCAARINEAVVDAEVEGLIREAGGGAPFLFRESSASASASARVPDGSLVRWSAAGTWQAEAVGLELGICYCWGGLWQVGLPLLLDRVG